MSDHEFICNLPGLIMSTHQLTDGVMYVNHGAKTVEFESWRSDSCGMRFYREDLDVLLYAVECVGYFDVSRPEEEDPEPIPGQDEIVKECVQTRLLEMQVEKKPAAIVAGEGITPELNTWALK